ncbi:MAG: O-acetyl-ADP-ribose deacetylase [Acidobacteriota bacterium]
MHQNFLSGRIMVKVGDITVENVDAIVNAANSTLLGGGGVDGAIHDAGGPQILAECRSIRAEHYPGGLPTGKAVITTGGELAAKYVIHTVGPIYGQNRGQDAALLAACYINSIELAASRGLASIAFPSISTGAYAFPKADAARVVSEALRASLAKHAAIDDVRLVFYSNADQDAFLAACTLD